jgi:SAM-dependent methyltransferase
MLAPRKKLWSTPIGAVDHALNWIKLKANDCVCDIGCGDGRILLQWATLYSTESSTRNNQVSFLGIDIDAERIDACRKALEIARNNGSIPDNISVTFLCANALEDSPDLLQNANIFFLYLIPRGLKLIHPLLVQHKERIGCHEMQIISFMNKIPGEKPVDRALVTVDHQPGAEWPLYFYKI